MRRFAFLYYFFQALTLSRSDTTNSVGDIVNLMSVDCQRIQDAMFYSYYLVSVPIAIVGVVYLLWLIMGKIVVSP